MNAFVCTRYGPPEVLELREIPTPKPSGREVLVRVHAATVTMGDCELRNLTLPAWTRYPVRLYMGYSKPRSFTPGMEFAGVVEAVGGSVTKFKVGDEVFGTTGMAMGGCAEYICRPQGSLATKPASVSFDDAATITVGGINALHFLRKANIQPGQEVLVIGGGGSIGSYAVLMALSMGAVVTAVDSARKLDVLRSIGAKEVIDYQKENFWDRPAKYDVIFDTVYQSSFDKCVAVLKENGCYLMANTGPRRMLRAAWLSATTRKRTVFSLAAPIVEDFNHVAALIGLGKIKPVIDRVFPLDQLVEAHRYVEAGNKIGNVIIRC